MSFLNRLFHRLADGGKARGPLDTLVQAACAVAEPFYTTAATLHGVAHRAGFAERRTLDAPVLSIGNITLGGTGKTPFTAWLVAHLQSMGRGPAVLTRGYGRDDDQKLVIVHDGRRLRADTRTAGDEPVMLASMLEGVPVVACADRWRAGKLALKRLGAEVLVLDDGFQHHRLHRDGDIVLVDATCPPRGLRLLPRGTLREPTAALRRAHLIVLTRWNQARHPDRAMADVKRAANGVPIVRANLMFDALTTLDGLPLHAPALRGTSAVIYCGVGNPQSVARTVEDLGIRVARVHAQPDHARPTRADVLAADALRRKLKVQHIIVTEKDAVKLRELGSLPPGILVIRARLEMATPADEAKALAVVRARLAARPTRGLLR